MGVFALGHTAVEEVPSAAHHLLLGHGLATAELRHAGAETIGITLNLAPVVPADPHDPAELDAADRVDAMLNRLVLAPVIKGAYEPYAKQMFSEGVVRDGDEAIIGQPI